MKELKIFITLFICLNSSAFSQTIEDLYNLGLTNSQLSICYEKRQMILTNSRTGKKKKIKEGAFGIVKLKNDTAKLEVFFEAFLTDSIIVSSLKPPLHEKEIKLGFSEMKIIPISEIDEITYSIKHRKDAYWAGFILTLAGVEGVILPIVMPVIIGNTEKVYSQPRFPYVIAGSAVLYYFGRRIQKSLIPKDYNLSSDWKWEVVKK